MLDQHRGRHHGQFGVGAPRCNGGNQADDIARSEQTHVGAHRLDNARRLVTQARRERCLLKVLAATKHRLRAVEPDGFDGDSDFSRPRLSYIDVIDREDFRATILIESYDAGHVLPP